MKETDYEKDTVLSRVGRSRKLMTVVGWCVSLAKDLRFIGRDFHKRERCCEMIDRQT